MGIYRTQRSAPSTNQKTSKIVFVHLILVVTATAYALIGGYIFHVIEGNHEHSKDLDRSQTMTHIRMLTSRILNDLDESSEISTNVSQIENSTLINLLRYLEIATGQDDLVMADILYGIENDEEVKIRRKWNYPSAILFAFTVITTIGYGNIAPSTFSGRLFCIFFGIFGIPLAMLAIADMGKFTTDFAISVWRKLRKLCANGTRKLLTGMRPKLRILGNLETTENVEYSENDGTECTVFIAALFLVYVFLGAAFLPLWEELQFFDAIYFSFVTLTTIGFGDIVPQRYMYLLPTLLYIIIGLALTTMTIESAGLYFRKLHYLGKKLTNAKNAKIWFGGKSLTTEEFIRAIGKELGIDANKIDQITDNLDQLVDNAVYKRENADKLTETSPPDTEESYLRFTNYLNIESLVLPYVDDDVESTARSKASTMSSFKGR